MPSNSKRHPDPQAVKIAASGVTRDLRARHMRRVIENAVANAFGVSCEELRAPTRRAANIAFARQAAMYLAHVGHGLSLTEVGALFERDRTTVAHGCSLIEDMRDDPQLDARLAALETALRCVGLSDAAGQAGKDAGMRGRHEPENASQAMLSRCLTATCGATADVGDERRNGRCAR